MPDKNKDNLEEPVVDDAKVDEAPVDDQTDAEPVIEEADNDESVDLNDQLTKANSQVAELTEQINQLEDKVLRSQAEISNIQTRTKKERADLLKYDGQRLATDILPVIDDLQRALSVETAADDQLKTGVEMVHSHLIKALADNGITKMESLNQKFDPNFHQAIQTAPATDDQPEDTIVQVLQEGYQIKDRVLRPAMVIVAK